MPPKIQANLSCTAGVTVLNYDMLQEAHRDGSRRATAWQAATVAGGRGTTARRRGDGHGQRGTRDDGAAVWWRPRSARDDEMGVTAWRMATLAGGHDGLGCDLRRGDTRHTPCQGREQASRAKRQVIAYKTNKEKQGGYMPSLPCAPSAHSGPLGFAPTTAHKQDPAQAPACHGHVPAL